MSFCVCDVVYQMFSIIISIENGVVIFDLEITRFTEVKCLKTEHVFNTKQIRKSSFRFGFVIYDHYMSNYEHKNINNFRSVAVPKFTRMCSHTHRLICGLLAAKIIINVWTLAKKYRLDLVMV